MGELLKHYLKENKTIVISYKDFCNENNKLAHDILNRWTRLGLLEGLDDEKSKKCAFCFEEMANYLISKSEEKVGDRIFEIVVFPIIRRVISKSNNFDCDNFNPEWIEQYWDENLEKADKKIKLLLKEKGIGLDSLDAEAELCALISDEIANIYNAHQNNGITMV